MLRKSVSNMTSSSGFSLVESSMLDSETSMGGTGSGSGSGSGVMVQTPNDGGNGGDGVKRGWDWRADVVSRETTADDVLRMLRLGLAREISRAWIESP